MWIRLCKGDWKRLEEGKMPYFRFGNHVTTRHQVVIEELIVAQLVKKLFTGNAAKFFFTHFRKNSPLIITNIFQKFQP